MPIRTEQQAQRKRVGRKRLVAFFLAVLFVPPVGLLALSCIEPIYYWTSTGSMVTFGLIADPSPSPPEMLLGPRSGYIHCSLPGGRAYHIGWQR